MCESTDSGMVLPLVGVTYLVHVLSILRKATLFYDAGVCQFMKMKC